MVGRTLYYTISNEKTFLYTESATARSIKRLINDAKK